MNGTESDLELLGAARQAMERAYSPYSGVRVGAAVLAEDGRVFTGCNVENASLGLTLCAERVALGRAVADGAGRVVAVAVASNHPSVASPCGACRQVLLELAPQARILFGDETGVHRSWASPRDLLPDAFDGSWRERDT